MNKIHKGKENEKQITATARRTPCLKQMRDLMNCKMPLGRPLWHRHAFKFYLFKWLTIPMGIGLRPETLSAFPHQCAEKIQFTIACFLWNHKPTEGKKLIKWSFISLLFCVSKE